MPNDRYTVSNVESQVSHLKYDMSGPGIEPRTMACQADVVTTTLPCVSLWGYIMLNKRHQKLEATALLLPPRDLRTGPSEEGW